MSMTDQYPILYSFRRCPYAMRARMALYLARQSYVLREVDLKAKPQAMLDISPKGTVPVFVYPDGRLLEESLDVVQTLLPAPATPIEPMVTLLTQRFVPALVRFKYHERYADVDRALEASRLIESMQVMLRWHTEGWLHDDPTQYTQHDVVLLPLLRQLFKADDVWFAEQAPRVVHQYVLSFVQSEMHDVVMQKHPAWVPDQLPVIVGKV